MFDNQGPKCPKCKGIVIKLISITDDGKGKKYCRDCKRKIRETYPEKDFRKVGAISEIDKLEEEIKKTENEIKKLEGNINGKEQISISKETSEEHPSSILPNN